MHPRYVARHILPPIASCQRKKCKDILELSHTRQQRPRKFCRLGSRIVQQPGRLASSATGRTVLTSNDKTARKWAENAGSGTVPNLLRRPFCGCVRERICSSKKCKEER